MLIADLFFNAAHTSGTEATHSYGYSLCVATIFRKSHRRDWNEFPPNVTSWVCVMEFFVATVQFPRLNVAI